MLLSALCLTMGAVQTPAQGFLNKMKKEGTRLVKKQAAKAVRDALTTTDGTETGNSATTTTRTTTNRTRTAQRQRTTATRNTREFTPGTKIITVKFCEGIGQKIWYGRVGGVTPEPPTDCPKQPAWLNPLPEMRRMTNARLVAEDDMHGKWRKKNGGGCEPVMVRRETCMDELSDRVNALNDAVRLLLHPDAEDGYSASRVFETQAFKTAVNSDLAPLYPHLEKETVEYLKSIDRTTKTIEVKVAEGNSSDGRMTQQGEMWFQVNSGNGTAKVACLDMDQSVGKDYTVPATITYAGRTFRVTEIGDGAFSEMKMKSVTLPEGLKKIGAQAFSRTQITSINIPSTVTEIKDRAFLDIQTLKSVTVPDNVKKMGLGVFSMCKALTTVKLPAALTSMGNTMFYGCTALTSVTLPQNLTSVPTHTFADCKSLTRVDLPASVTKIEQNAFQNTALTSVPIPESLTSIEYSAFEGCRRLTSVSIPSRVELNFSAFKDCKGLKKVAIGSQYKGDLSALYSFFMGCTFINQTMRTIPSCVTYNE